MPGTSSRLAFIRAHTVLQSPPLVPEIRLHLASDAMALWNETEALSAAAEAGAGVLPPPYWAFAWPGGQALARYILDTPQEVAGKTVLDIGAGSGLLAIAAAKAGAGVVVAADIDPFALAAIELNAAANGVFVEPIGNDLIGAEPRWEAVLAGDMCYERPLAGRLMEWLRGLASAGRRVLLGDPGRNYLPCGGMVPLAAYAVPTSRELEDREVRATSVYAVEPRNVGGWRRRSAMPE